MIEGRVFQRACSEGEPCGDWVEGKRSFSTLPQTGPGWLSPRYALFVLSRAEDGEYDDSATNSDPDEIHFRATFNPIQTVVESGKEVTADLDPSDIIFEEPLQEHLEYFDEHPSPIDVWASREDGFIHRLSILLPTGDSLDDLTYFRIDVSFSNFDAVVVERPF